MLALCNDPHGAVDEGWDLEFPFLDVASGHNSKGSLLTAPQGVHIFTAIAVFRRPYLEVIRGTPPFIFMLLIATFVLILFPQLSLWLPGLGG